MPDKPPVKISKSHQSKVQHGLPASPPTDDDQSSNNAASNGYWVHDDVGPKHYVAPTESSGLNVDEGDLVARIAVILQSTARQDASRMHIALEQGVVILKGTAVSEMQSELVGRDVQTVAGQVQVVNRLVIDETLQKTGNDHEVPNPGMTN